MRTSRFIVIVAALAAAVTLPAQFGGLNKLGDALNKAKKGIDTAKDVATVAKGASGQFSDEEEQVMGDSVALEILSRYGGLWRDEEATRRVNLVGNSLARYSERPAMEWRFGILDSDSVNAFSAPGGYVFITRGLYDLASTDDLLAGILSHEIAHITNRHALKIVGRGEALSVIGKHATARSSELQQAQAQVDTARAQAAQVSPELAKFLDVNVGKVADLIMSKGFDAKTEFSADRDGRELALTTGYAPGGLRAVLVMLQAKKGDAKKLFPTHPPVANRLKELPKDPEPPAVPGT
jgi:predicted Zn-dependent protease